MRILGVLAVVTALALVAGNGAPARAQMQPAVASSGPSESLLVPAAWGGNSIKDMPVERLVMIGLGAGAGVYLAEMFLAGAGGQLATVGGLIIGALVGDRAYKEFY